MLHAQLPLTESPYNLKIVFRNNIYRNSFTYKVTFCRKLIVKEGGVAILKLFQ